MPKYEVTICRTIISTCIVEITANNEDSAAEKAITRVEKNLEKQEWNLQYVSLAEERVYEL